MRSIHKRITFHRSSAFAPQVDGLSLAPLMKSGRRLDREAIFWHYPLYGFHGGSPSGAIRSGLWILIEFFTDSHLGL